MDLEHRVAEQFARNIEHTSHAASLIGPSIVAASSSIVESLLQGGKILTCGNGGSASAAQHFMAKMSHRYERERPGLPCIALNSASSTMTSLADGVSYEHVFSNQIAALGHPGDGLLVISVTGNSPNILRATDAAHERQMRVVALNGNDGGKLAQQLREHDQEIRVPGESNPRVQEVQLLVIHCLCDLIDAQLIGN